MAREQGGEAPVPAAAEGIARGSRDLLRPVPLLRGAGAPSESLRTVLVALGANVLIAVAKSAAAVVTGSASLVATRWVTAGKPTCGRCSPRSGSSWPAAPYRLRTASPN